MNQLEKIVLVVGFMFVGVGVYSVVLNPKEKDAIEHTTSTQEGAGYQDIDKEEGEEDDV